MQAGRQTERERYSDTKTQGQRDGQTERETDRIRTCLHVLAAKHDIKVC